MPGAVINRAWDLLDELENGSKSSANPAGYQLQMPFGDPQKATEASEALDELKELDIANMTPLEAINTLFKLQEQANRTTQ
jgi:DNA mismatch repair protein MutS